MRDLIGKLEQDDPLRNKFQSCNPKDVTCACKIPDFGYGIRDCSRSNCDDLEQVNEAIGLANLECGTTLANDTTFIPHSRVPDPTGAPTPTPIATSSWTTLTTSGSFISTIETSTIIFGIGGTPVPPSGSPAQTTGAPATTTTDGTAATTGTPAGSGDAANTATDAEGSASSSSSSGLGAQATAAPMAGFLAAAGLVVALL
ncbi:hypothetical protein B0T14DRAFT_511421 [Immersiella caudata]|uniref:CFEM domain-containing protein n=1 Tax=Immersiella caudata TaxID=314043 RepID=A0AA40C6P1_9PEZI|nr:hypothetical protein B0T14DRAFT_511421 [Immersiella caudata]